MNGRVNFRWGVGTLVGLLTLCYAVEVEAQFATNPLPNNNQPLFQGQLGGQNSNLTPEQIQSMMMMRAMQGRGRRGVQSGMPQNVGGMGSGGGGFGDMPFELQNPTGAESSRKSSAQRRAEVRKARDQQKNAIREDEKAKKAKGGKKANDPKVAKKAPPKKAAK